MKKWLKWLGTGGLVLVRVFVSNIGGPPPKRQYNVWSPEAWATDERTARAVAEQLPRSEPLSESGLGESSAGVESIDLEIPAFLRNRRRD